MKTSRVYGNCSLLLLEGKHWQGIYLGRRTVKAYKLIFYLNAKIILVHNYLPNKQRKEVQVPYLVAKDNRLRYIQPQVKIYKLSLF